MSTDPQQLTDQITNFIRNTFSEQGIHHAVIAVSGGIDSAVALTLLTKAIGKDHVTALLLPYGNQPMEDAVLITQHLVLPEANVKTININRCVDAFAELLGVTENDAVRLGNLKARARMMCVFDTAKAQEAMVCGTENKSEHYLGYFTRFGDAASDIEPLSQFYKTQVRQISEHLQLPMVFLEKPPSAGLWQGQTDEVEMGFTYEQADKVLEQLIDLKKVPSEIVVEGLSPEILSKILQQVESMKFKLQVPYEMGTSI